VDTLKILVQYIGTLQILVRQIQPNLLHCPEVMLMVVMDIHTLLMGVDAIGHPQVIQVLIAGPGDIQVELSLMTEVIPGKRIDIQ